jgi:phosphatidylglycerol lysyltransferase
MFETTMDQVLACPSDERRRAHDLVLRFGRDATVFQILCEGYRYFFHGDGCVAYVDTGAAWVAAGAPVGPEAELRALALGFVAAAGRAGRRSCFFGSDTRFAHVATGELSALPIGEQPVWDPRTWDNTLRAHKGLRAQLRYTRRKGVRVRRMPHQTVELTPHIRSATAELVRRWLATRHLPALGFLLRIDPDRFTEQRQCFLAEHDGRLVGLLHVIPVPERDGWSVEHMVRVPEAPNGTVELLVDAVMRWGSEQGSPWLTLGLAPLAGADVPLLLRVARKRLAFLYNFDGLRRFKAKLKPATWQPVYLAYPPTQGAFFTILDVLAAFARPPTRANAALAG